MKMEKSMVSGGQNQQANAYMMNYGAATSPATDVPSTGLMILVDRVNEARNRVGAVTAQINMVSLGIHGPRPEPVGAPKQTQGHADSLRSRLDDLMDDIISLEESVRSLIR